MGSRPARFICISVIIIKFTGLCAAAGEQTVGRPRRRDTFSPALIYYPYSFSVFVYYLQHIPILAIMLLLRKKKNTTTTTEEFEGLRGEKPKRWKPECLKRFHRPFCTAVERNLSINLVLK